MSRSFARFKPWGIAALLAATPSACGGSVCDGPGGLCLDLPSKAGQGGAGAESTGGLGGAAGRGGTGGGAGSSRGMVAGETGSEGGAFGEGGGAGRSVGAGSGGAAAGASGTNGGSGVGGEAAKSGGRGGKSAGSGGSGGTLVLAGDPGAGGTEACGECAENGGVGGPPAKAGAGGKGGTRGVGGKAGSGGAGGPPPAGCGIDDYFPDTCAIAQGGSPACSSAGAAGVASGAGAGGLASGAGAGGLASGAGAGSGAIGAAGAAAAAGAGNPTVLHLIDDFDDGDALSETVFGVTGGWYASNDGAGKQYPSGACYLELPGSGMAPGVSGSGLRTYGYGFTSWAELGLGFGCGALDASSVTGVHFLVRGAWPQTVRFMINTAATTPPEYGGFCTSNCWRAFTTDPVVAHTDWLDYWIPFSRLSNGTDQFDASQILGIIWESSDPSCFDFTIDDVALYGP